MSKTWKEHERRTAKRLSGTRNGNRGTATCDVQAGAFAVECKARKDLPAWLTDAMNQAKRNAGEGQTGIVVLHRVGARSDSDIVCMTMKDFEAITKGLTPHEQQSIPTGADLRDTRRKTGV